MNIKLKEKEKDGFDWIDISNPKKEDLNEIALQYNLHYTLVKDSLQPEHLPKYEMVNEVHFIIIRVFDQTAPSSSDTIQEITNKIAIFIGKDFIITIHRASSTFLEEVRLRLSQWAVPYTHFDVLHRIISASFFSYDGLANKLVQDLDFYEAKIFLKEKIPTLLKNLYLIKRKAAAINRILNLSKTFLDSLQNHMPNPILQDLRDTAIRIKTSSEQTIENVSNLLNIYISLSSQKTNEVVRVLTVFSVFFMPLTFIVGIYGMNFHYMPELTYKYGYHGVLAFMAILTIVIYLWFKRKHWL